MTWSNPKKKFKKKPKRAGGFKRMETDLMAEGKSKKSADAIAASVGRKTYGKKAFQEMAAAGRKRGK